LLDRALPDEERQEIINIVTAWPGVSGAHDLRTRQSGPTRFIQIHLEMEDNLPLVQAHVIADQVEQAILRRFPGPMSLSIRIPALWCRRGRVF
jgi:ferrous-iron efflux pump FieF